MTVPESYSVKRISELTELGLTSYELEHKKSGARVILLPAEDDNKVFAIGFRTPPVDDTGLPHILEHSVLCGSDKYPVKDPFVELMKTSPNTFLNAMTFSDKTVYPVASCNPKDFNNLMDVYLDAVLHPRIHSDERIFRQEGWRYEIDSTEGELQLNGVVYSEMKGAFSSVDESLERYSVNSLFPDTAYGFESGGDPEKIPTLSYEDFCRFHKQYYHPSNSYILLYGNCDMEERLSFLDREYLSAYDRIEVHSELTLQKPFEALRRFSYSYPLGVEEEEAGRYYYSLQWACGTALDVRTAMAMSVLDSVLLQSPGAPLRKALLDAGLGKDISGGYSASNGLQSSYSIVVKEAAEGEQDRLLSIVRETLTRLAEEGLNRTSLRAAISSSEFQTREADFGGLPKGLVYGIEILRCWLYDGEDPFRGLRYEEDFAFLRDQVDKGYYEQLIRDHLLNNPHASLVEMQPVKGKAEADAAALREKLAAYKASLSAEELEQLVKSSQELKTWQETPDSPEALASIPQLTLAEMRKECRIPENRETELGSRRLTYRSAESCGIAYLTLQFDLGNVPEELIPWLGLYRAAFSLVSTGKHDYQQLYDQINETTGGLSLALDTYTDFRNGEQHYVAAVSLKALYDKLQDGLALLKEIICESSYDDGKRLKEILQETVTEVRELLISRGHVTAVGRCGAYYDKRALFTEMTSGIAFLRFLNGLEEDLDAKLPAIGEKLAQLGRLIFTADGLRMNLTAEEKALPELMRTLREFSDSLPEDPARRFSLSTPDWRNEGFKTNGAVGYVCLAGTYQAAGPYTGALRVLQSVLSSGYLWQTLRVKGGAYGAMCGFRMGGDGYFVSYRDPNVKESLEAYRAIPQFLQQLELPQEALEGFIISTIGGMDLPLTPSMVHDTDFRYALVGVEGADLQRERDEVLGCSLEKLKALVPYVEAILSEDCRCAVGSGVKLEEEKELFSHIESL